MSNDIEKERRYELQALLEDILGSRNVYYQPPTNIYMKYPAIVYSRDMINSFHADNGPYKLRVAYTVTLIDEDPDSQYVMSIARLPMCRHVRNYKADNLNHDVFTLFY